MTKLKKYDTLLLYAEKLIKGCAVIDGGNNNMELEVNPRAEEILKEDQQRKQFDPQKLHKLNDLPNLDISSLDETQLQTLVQTKTGKRGRPKKAISPFDTVEVDEESGAISKVVVRGAPSKELRALKTGKVSEETLYNIASVYFRNPDWTTVGLITGHTADFLIAFSRTFKFHEMLAEIRASLDKKEEAKETDIIEEVLEQIEDRVRNGDHILDSKTGEVKVVKMKGKELASTLKTIHNVRQTTRGEANSRTESVNPADKLKSLAEQFAKFASARDITPEQ